MNLYAKKNAIEDLMAEHECIMADHKTAIKNEEATIKDLQFQLDLVEAHIEEDKRQSWADACYERIRDGVDLAHKVCRIPEIDTPVPKDDYYVPPNERCSIGREKRGD